MIRHRLTATIALALCAGAAQAGYLFQDVVDPANPGFTQVLGINNAGTIVGYGNASAFNGFSAVAPYGGAQFTRENFPGSSATQVVGISGLGTTVGFWVDVTGANHGFVDVGGTYSTVDAPGTAFDQLLGIGKSNGLAVGYSSTDAAGATLQRAFVFNTVLSAYTYIDTLLPANINSQATGINDAGAAVGFFEDVTGAFEGFEDVAGVVTTIDVPGALSTQALGINGLGQIVGDYTDAGGAMHGFLDIGGVFTTLDPAASTATTINGINDLGQIVGFYTNAQGLTLGFQGQPQANAVPEPGGVGLTLLALTLAACARRRTRR